MATNHALKFACTYCWSSCYASPLPPSLPPSLPPGGPGSGKGTHCARVVSEFNFAHLSTGDLLRGEVEKGSAIGREVEETMRQGKLVPSVSNVLCELQYAHYLVCSLSRQRHLQHVHALVWYVLMTCMGDLEVLLN